MRLNVSFIIINLDTATTGKVFLSLYVAMFLCLLSLIQGTCKLLQSSAPHYLHDIITIQP